MKCTFTLPSGASIETRTQRDFILIREDSKGPFIQKRSDHAAVIEDIARRMRRNPRIPVRQFFGDTTTGSLRELP